MLLTRLKTKKTTIPETAMVLAAGRGTRLAPLTDTVPKPLTEVDGKALIDHILERLIAVGVKRVVVNTFHLGEQIEAHLAGRTDVEIIRSEEHTSELQSHHDLVCRLLLEKQKNPSPTLT